MSQAIETDNDDSLLLVVDAEGGKRKGLVFNIFYSLSVWELQHVQLPIVFSRHQDIPQPKLAEAYYVIVPKPAPSPGDRLPGRHDIRLDFPAKTAL